jgi:hypothetical protein
VPKTGGTWLFEVLKKNAPASWEAVPTTPAHVMLHEVPVALEQWVDRPERVGLPIIATVRNPWDWYVSMYFFLEQHYRNGTGGFAVPRNQWPGGLRQWADTFTGGNSVEGFRRAMPRVLDAMHVSQRFGAMRPQYNYLRAHDGRLGVTPVRFEAIRTDMASAILATGAELPGRLRRDLLKSPKKNTSGHAHYSRCYTPELRDLVAKHEAWLIETFGYTFESVS